MSGAATENHQKPERRRWGRLVIWAMAVLIVTGITWAFMPAPVVVDVAQVYLATFESGIQEEGRARLRQRHRLVAPFSAQLERVKLSVGDPVHVGETVARLWALPPPLVDWRSITTLRQRASSAQASLDQARAGEAREAAALAIAQAQAERDSALARSGYLSPAAAENARLLRSQHQATLRAAVFAREAAEHELAAARSALLAVEAMPLQADQQTLTLRAPVDGWIVAVVEDSETTVTAGRTILEIGDLRDIEVVVDVLSQRVADIRPGMSVRIRSASDVPPIAGTVRRVEPVAKTRVSALGVEEQRVNVLVDLVDSLTAQSPTSNLMMGDGWRVDAFIITRSEPQVRQVPVGALFRHGDTWQMFILDEGRARRRQVTVIARSAGTAWIGDEIANGQAVIVFPPDALRDGTRVRPRAAAGPL
jgi:HlyD family secretion protein